MIFMTYVLSDKLLLVVELSSSVAVISEKALLEYVELTTENSSFKTGPVW